MSADAPGMQVQGMSFENGTAGLKKCKDPDWVPTATSHRGVCEFLNQLSEELETVGLSSACYACFLDIEGPDHTLYPMLQNYGEAAGWSVKRIGGKRPSKCHHSVRKSQGFSSKEGCVRHGGVISRPAFSAAKAISWVEAMKERGCPMQ